MGHYTICTNYTFYQISSMIFLLILLSSIYNFSIWVNYFYIISRFASGFHCKRTTTASHLSTNFFMECHPLFFVLTLKAVAQASYMMLRRLEEARGLHEMQKMRWHELKRKAVAIRKCCFYMPSMNAPVIL